VINESSSTFEVLRAYLLARASISEEEMAALNERIVSSISASAHDRYLRFLETHPLLATRAPQWMLASYVAHSASRTARTRLRPGQTSS
jgi:hypothetical protein